MTDWEPPLPVVVVVLVFTGITGWLCVFRTNILVSWAQNNYRKNKIVRWRPGSGIVFKSWYPTYLRCMGVYLWAFGALIVGLFVISAVGH